MTSFSPENAAPDWKSYQTSHDPANIVRSTEVATVFGTKIDAQGGQAQGLLVHDGIFATAMPSGQTLTLQNTSGTSLRTGVHFANNGWALIHDQTGEGDRDLAFYNGETNNTPFRYTADEQLFLWSTIDKQLSSNAYAGIGVGVLINQNLGYNTPIIGSTSALNVSQCIFDVGSLTDGTFSEMSAIYTMTGPMDWSKTLGPHHVIAYDNHSYSQPTTDPTKRSGMMFGMSLLGRAMGMNDWVIDQYGSGTFGYAAATTPPSADEITYYNGAKGLRSYPHTAGISIVGISGTSDIFDGNQAGADHGYVYGFRVGGGGGTPYMHTDARSRIFCGGCIGDFTDYGLYIDSPLTSANAKFPSSLTLCAQDSSSSKYCGVGFGIDGTDGTGGYLIVQDTAKNNTPDFGIYNRMTGVVAFHIGPSGGVAFNGAAVTAPPQLPAPLSPSSSAAQILAFDNALASALVSLGLCTQASS